MKLVVVVDKKGSTTYTQLYMILVLFYAAFLVFSISYVVGEIRGAASNDIFEMEQRVIETRMLYSPQCLAASSEDDRVRPGIIDIENFNEVIRDNCMNFQRIDQLAVQVRLSSKNDEVMLTSPNWQAKTGSTITVSNRYIALLNDNTPAYVDFIYKQ